jgi:hypothetical protein
MSLRVLTVSLLACALCAALVPAARAAGTNPFIAKVRPLDVAIGETPTIADRGFLPENAPGGSDAGSDHDDDGPPWARSTWPVPATAATSCHSPTPMGRRSREARRR